jgi:hypothetical protein
MSQKANNCTETTITVTPLAAFVGCTYLGSLCSFATQEYLTICCHTAQEAMASTTSTTGVVIKLCQCKHDVRALFRTTA